MIKFNDVNNQFSGNALYSVLSIASNNNLISNGSSFDPKFKNTTKNQLNILDGSAAIGRGKDLIIPLPDILNKPRPLIAPDMGAYQYIP